MIQTKPQTPRNWNLHENLLLFRDTPVLTVDGRERRIERLYTPHMLPHNCFIMEDMIAQLPPALQELYRGDILSSRQTDSERPQRRLFITDAIPASTVPLWEEFGALRHLLDMVTGGNWMERSVEQWRVSTSGLPMEQAIVYDALPYSPLALPFLDDPKRTWKPTEGELASYEHRFLYSASTAMLFGNYTGQFRLPELLLPFPIPRDALTLERIID